MCVGLIVLVLVLVYSPTPNLLNSINNLLYKGVYNSTYTLTPTLIQNYNYNMNCTKIKWIFICFDPE